MGLVLPMPGDMSAGRLVNVDDALPSGVADDEEATSESRSAPLFTDALIVGTRAVKLLL